MRYLFFDTECANSFNSLSKICSLGYVLCDSEFNIIEMDDLIINPESGWDRRVIKDILYYKRDYYESFPSFPYYYEKIKSLFKDSMVFGHSVRNDVINLSDAFLRYDLEPFDYSFYDTQRLYMAYKGITDNEPSLQSVALDLNLEHQNDKHTSVQDARITMQSLNALLKVWNIDLASMLAKSENASGTYINGNISEFIHKDINVLPKRNLTFHNKNSKLYSYILNNQVINKDSNSSLCGKNIGISFNYENNHFLEMIYIIKYLNSIGAYYKTDPEKLDIYYRYDQILADGTIKKCSREEVCLSRNIEIKELSELLALVDLNEANIKDNYFNSLKEEKRALLLEKERVKSLELKKDKERRADNRDLTSNLGDLLKELLNK